jgi:alkylation response protein AidB-like acyl-CoA dehydrogenase
MTDVNTHYLAPLQDMGFLMNEMPDSSDHMFILEQAAHFAQKELAPINALGDSQGCRLENGQVTLPCTMKAALKRYAQGGWMGLGMPEQFGGQGLPETLSAFVGEMLTSANHAFSMTPALTMSACGAILAYGSDALKQTYLSKMIHGTWTGTMCMTESHCGSDLGLIRTRATPIPTPNVSANIDGKYSIKGTKIFISAGSHDASDNIIHLVLARIKGAPKGIKGLSLFLVPTQLQDESGEWLKSNNVTCIGIEEKMGIHANPTCTMAFEESFGYLIGEENKGINAMFAMMNEMRLGTALQGVGLSERSFQKSLSYARDRTQMRSLSGVKAKDKEADPIIEHPDVRRMLLTQKVFAQGGRALAQFCAQLLDETHDSSTKENDKDSKEKQMLLDMLTPIAKGFCTEVGLESASLAIQVHGGHGFIKESGVEQLYRDGRIATLYEGTTGIQALDLLGRKVLGTQGKSLMVFTKKMHAFYVENKDNKPHHVLLDDIKHYSKEWPQLTMQLGGKAMKNPDEVGAASFDYLMYSGYVTLAYFWAKMAIRSQQLLDEKQSGKSNKLDEGFLKDKIANAEFYFERILPRATAHKQSMLSGWGNLQNI